MSINEKKSSENTSRNYQQKKPGQERKEGYSKIKKPYNAKQAQRQDNQGKSYQKRKKFVNKSNQILSVVIPLYNESESLPELSLQLEGELQKLSNGRYEVIFVDDGSTDDSFEKIKMIKERNHKFRAIRFRRNYGKAAALSAGFDMAKGVIVATMDADLQDDPAELKNMIDKLKEGYDLVSGWKKKRKDPISKRILSKIYNFTTSVTTGLRLHDYNCGIKVYKRDVIKSIQIYGDMHRYIPVLAHWEGFKVSEVPVKHHARRYGKSKYGFTRIFKGYLDLLTVLFTTRYLKRPLHFLGTIGTLFTLAGFGIDLYLLIQWIMDKTALSNRPLLSFGIALIIVGVQLISLGLIGEMIVKNSLEKQKYSIKERL